MESLVATSTSHICTETKQQTSENKHTLHQHITQTGIVTDYWIWGPIYKKILRQTQEKHRIKSDLENS